MSLVNKSLSTSNIEEMGIESTPLNFITKRNKRPREDDFPEEFNTFKQEIKDMFKSFMVAQRTQLEGIITELKEIQQTNANIEGSISLITAQNEEFRQKIEILESQAKLDREYITVLEHKIDDLQRSLRKTSIELKNVPRKNQETREDLLKMMSTLSTNINLEMKPDDIKDIYRLPAKRDGGASSPPIIVELGSTILKSDLMKKVKAFNIKNRSKLQAKHLGFTAGEDTPVFISEQLTPKGARLFFLARDLVKTKKYKYCWTSFGKIFVRQDDTSRIIQITNEAQVHQLIQSI